MGAKSLAIASKDQSLLAMYRHDAFDFLDWVTRIAIAGPLIDGAG